MLRILLLTAVTLLFARMPLAHLFDVAGIPGRSHAAPGERELKALAAVWPDSITEVGFRGGDWALRLGGKWIAWANGRLLPVEDAGRWKEYAAIPFYSYPLSLPRLPELDVQAAAELRKLVAADLRNPPRRSEAFFGSLLDAGNRAATEADLVKMEVAGFTVTVHDRLAGPLARVSDELKALRRKDPAVASFLRELSEMNGYNYRFVEGTRSRSLHSYGLAVDMIPKSYRGLQPYWLWAMNKVPDFWTIPYDRRWMPPLAVIEAFERQGFIWGGKWLFFDTMHFEYRPDLLLMARAEPVAAAVAGLPES